MWACEVKADSIHPDDPGNRLTTVVATYPRCIHAEVLTHRVFSRNAASSRAIPASRMIEAVESNPYIPETWGGNKPGMVAGEPVSEGTAACALREWKRAIRDAARAAKALEALVIHKQWINRLLEPFAWITTVITGNQWDGFFALRDHPAAMPEMQRLARMLREAIAGSTPKVVPHGQWHIPFLDPEESADWSTERCRQVAAGRLARVSYLTHDGRRCPDDDVKLAERLASERPIHASPFEHIATPIRPDLRRNNTPGWRQMRQDVEMMSNG